MTRRQAVARQAQEDTIAEGLLESIPIVDSPVRAATSFETVEEEVILAGPGSPPSPPPEPEPAADAEPAPEARIAGPPASELAVQLRAQMGDAFAAELDRVEATIAAAVGQLEGELAEERAARADLEGELATERAAREAAQARLAEFKRLALG